MGITALDVGLFYGINRLGIFENTSNQLMIHLYFGEQAAPDVMQDAFVLNVPDRR